MKGDADDDKYKDKDDANDDDFVYIYMVTILNCLQVWTNNPTFLLSGQLTGDSLSSNQYL